MLRHLKTAAAFAAALMLCSCGEVVERDEYTDFSETTEAYEETSVSRREVFSGVPELSEFDEKSKSNVTEVPEKKSEEKTEDKPREEKNSEISAKTSAEAVEVPEEKTEDKPRKENISETSAKADEETAVTNELPKPDYKAAGCIEVPYRSQDDLPTGCELVSTSMLLKYYGFETEPLELIDGGYVLNENLERDGGVTYGGDPNRAFIGDPRSRSGYGCYSGAIYDGLCRFLENELYDTYYLTGMSLNDICLQYIDFGEPVVIWGSIGMEQLYYNDSSSWIVRDTGEEFNWLSNEHCMVLVGYDDNYYYIHDPLKGAYTPYERELVDMRFAEMGSQAITIRPW